MFHRHISKIHPIIGLMLLVPRDHLTRVSMFDPGIQYPFQKIGKKKTKVPTIIRCLSSWGVRSTSVSLFGSHAVAPDSCVSPEDVQSHKEVVTLVAVVPLVRVSQHKFTKGALLHVSASFSIYLPTTLHRPEMTKHFDLEDQPRNAGLLADHNK